LSEKDNGDDSPVDIKPRKSKARCQAVQFTISQTAFRKGTAMKKINGLTKQEFILHLTNAVIPFLKEEGYAMAATHLHTCIEWMKEEAAGHQITRESAMLPTGYPHRSKKVNEFISGNDTIRVHERLGTLHSKDRARYFVAVNGCVSKVTEQGWELGGAMGYNWRCDAVNEASKLFMALESHKAAIDACHKSIQASSSPSHCEVLNQTIINHKTKIDYLLSRYTNPVSNS
jgi:hypothetical protein